MKKILCTILIATIVMSVMSVSAFAEIPIRIVVGGEKLVTDVNPVIVNGRTLVPLRAIFEALDATVEWNNDTRTVTATKDDTVISLTIGEDVMKVNSADVKLDVAAQIVDDRTMIPVRAVSEALDCVVEWNNDTRTVRIKTDMWKISSVEYCHVGFVGDEETVDYKWEEYTYNDDGTVRLDEYVDETNGSKEKLYHWINIMTYDKDGNLVKVVDINPETNKETVLEEYVYENGFLVEDPFKKYSYDDNGRLIKVVTPSGDYYEVYTYDEKGNIIHTEKKSTDSYGYTIDTIDYAYDDRGNVACKKESYERNYPGNVETKTYTTEYVYDSDNNLIYEKGDDWTKEYSYEDGKLDYCEYEDSNSYELTEYDYWGDIPVEYFMDDDEMEWVTFNNEYLNPYNKSYILDYIGYDTDEEGRLVEIDYDDYEDYAFSRKITYDENGNVSLIEDSDGSYTKYEYVKVKW